MQRQGWPGLLSGTGRFALRVPKALVQLWRSLCCPGSGLLPGDRSPDAPLSPSAGLGALFPQQEHLEGEVFTCSRVTLCFCGHTSLTKLIPKDVAGPPCLQATIPQMQPHCLA